MMLNYSDKCNLVVRSSPAKQDELYDAIAMECPLPSLSVCLLSCSLFWFLFWPIWRRCFQLWGDDLGSCLCRLRQISGPLVWSWGVLEPGVLARPMVSFYPARGLEARGSLWTREEPAIGYILIPHRMSKNDTNTNFRTKMLFGHW
jgi:hypothetical protein